MKFREFLHILKVRWDTRFLEKTKKSRTELRHQYTTYEGKVLTVMDYIDHVVKLLPVMDHHGIPVDHRNSLREIYYKYDLNGLQHYIKIMNRNMDKAGREKYLQRKEKRKLKGK
jgi:hypothetical protein